MSTLTDDKQALENPKVGTGEKAPLRDQLPKKLLAALTKKQYGQKIVDLWSTHLASRAQWDERQRAFLSQWDDFLVDPSGGSVFEGSSNLKLPLPYIVCKTFHARAARVFMGAASPVSVKARREDGVEAQQTIEDFLSYTMKDWANENRGIDPIIDLWLWQWITCGSGVVKWRWEKKYTKYVDVVDMPVLKQVMYRVDENGNEVSTPVMGTEEKEVELIKKCFEGPCLDFVSLDDFGIVGGDGDPDKADVVFHRQFLTDSELGVLADSGTFDKKSVKEVIDGGPDNANISSQATLRQLNSGISLTAGGEVNDKHEVLEAYLSVDVDDSGMSSEVVCWVHARTGAILRASYLYRTNKEGKRPFCKIDFHRRAGQPFGAGLVEMLYPLFIELDAMHNQRIDWGIISNMPFGFYRATSSLEPETMKIKPGALIATDNPRQDVYFPEFGNRTFFGIQEEQAILGWIERATAFSDLTYGMMTGNQGAARTATGAQILGNEADANLAVFFLRLSHGFKKLVEYLFHMLQQKVPAPMSFRVTGNSGNSVWQKLGSTDMLAYDMDFEVRVNPAQSNQLAKMAVAQQVLSITSNPLDYQLGLVTPAQRYEALKNMLTALEIKDISKFVVKPHTNPIILLPQEEANRILNGIDVPLSPEQDHAGFIAYVNTLFNDEAVLGSYTKEQVTRLGQQASAHNAMMQALQKEQNQRANEQQILTNQTLKQ